MITKLEISGFKSFKDFSIEFSPFTVIAGKNASGKSNLFDALELLSRCANCDLRMAFPERRGTIIEQFTKLNNFNSVEMHVNHGFEHVGKIQKNCYIQGLVHVMNCSI